MPAPSSSPTDPAAGHQPREAIGEILRFMQFLADDETITIDDEVARSEQRTGFRNFALANYMKSLRHARPSGRTCTLGVYFHHCAIAMSCRQLALAGRFLAARRQQPGDRALGGRRPSARAASTR